MTILAVLVVVVQAAAGAGWWLLVRRGATATEILGVGLALGTFAAMMSAMVLVATPLAGVAWLLPAVVVAPLVLWRRRSLRVSPMTLPEGVALAVGTLAGLVLLVANWVRVPLGEQAAASYADLSFFEALSRGLADNGPNESILMSGGSLRYHWFTYAWAGSVARAGDTETFAALTRVLPTVTLIGVVLVVAAWSARLSSVRWVPTLAVLLVVVAGYAGALYGGILNFDSPSQAMTTLWLLTLLLAIALWVTEGHRWTLPVIAALAVASTGGKVSHGIVAVGAVGLLAAVGLITRAVWWRRSVIALLVVAVGVATTYLIVLSGVAIERNIADDLAVKASTWQGLDPVGGTVGVVLGTVALLLAVLARLAGLGWLLATPSGRRSPDTWLATGGVLVGILAMLVLRQGINDLWFILAASAPGAVLSAVGVGAALSRASRLEQHGRLRRALPWAVIVAIPPTVACLVLSWTWPDGRAVLNWLAPLSVWILAPITAAIVVATLSGGRRRVLVGTALALAALTLTAVGSRVSSVWTTSRPVTTEAGRVQPQPGGAGSAVATYQDAQAAADWLALQSGALVATSDPTSALVPALSGRTMFLAGERYQVGLGPAASEGTVLARSAQSRAFADAPSTSTAAPLCAAGVDYAWLEPGSGEVPDRALAFRVGTVRIVDLAAFC